MSELLKLAERCEAVGGPDAALDCLIENALGIAKFERDPRVGYGDADYNRISPKPYTASLDAAMTLVPEGWSAKIYVHPSAGECHAEIYQLGEIVETATGLIRPYATGGTPVESGPCATAPLALCAAILRALAAQEQS